MKLYLFKPMCLYLNGHTAKPAHVVTSIKQSPVLKGHLFFPVIEHFIWNEPLLKGHLSYEATFSLSQRWPLNTGFIVLWFHKMDPTNCNLIKTICYTMVHDFVSHVFIGYSKANLKIRLTWVLSNVNYGTKHICLMILIRLYDSSQNFVQIQSNFPMRSPVLKGHIFLVLSWKISYELNLKRSPVLKDHFFFVPLLTS